MDRLLTIHEVAKTLSVSRGTVYRLIHEGAFEVVMVGSRWRVRESNLKEYIKRLPNALPVASRGDDDLEYVLDHLERTGKAPQFNLNTVKRTETP
jgi:excisionase family DNA binding protein